VNYLGHAYLSFSLAPVLTGNMISDYVKGKKKLDFPSAVQTGINLHRFIDSFTDSHVATKAASKLFKPAYGLYSGAFVDVVYDHFLANDPNEFSLASLYQFSLDTYASLDKFVPVFPEKFRLLFPYMKQHNWLYHYHEQEAIARSFEGVVRRAAYLKEGATAYTLFKEHYEELQQHYTAFFPELKQYAWDTLQQLLKEQPDEQG